MRADKRTARYKDIGGRPNVPMMGMLDRELRQVRAKVVPNIKRETLQNEILNHVGKGSVIFTDQATAYDQP
jgi:hypothetical protein